MQLDNSNLQANFYTFKGIENSIETAQTLHIGTSLKFTWSSVLLYRFTVICIGIGGLGWGRDGGTQGEEKKGGVKWSGRP